MAVAYLGLGSNLGNRLAFLRQARQALSEHSANELTASSAVYETAAQGGPPDSPDYLNAVLIIRTTLPPRQMLSLCQAIEEDFGRIRGVRWGPRTLDIDLLMYDDQVVDEDGLQIPHPRLPERLFVLVPLAEIAPRAIHPRQGVAITALLERCRDSSAVHLLRADW